VGQLAAADSASGAASATASVDATIAAYGTHLAAVAAVQSVGSGLGRQQWQAQCINQSTLGIHQCDTDSKLAAFVDKLKEHMPDS
jgi:hypothetical protein